MSQELIWDIFFLLHYSRGEGFNGPLRIPVSEALACKDLTFEDPLDLITMVRLLDDTFFEWVKENNK